MGRVKRYLTRALIARAGLILVAVAALAALFEFFADGDKVIEATGGDAMAVLRYLALTMPGAIVRIAPFAALVAGVLTLANLARHSELAAMRSAGLSQAGLAAGLAPAAALIAGPIFFIEAEAAPSAVQALQAWGVGAYEKKEGEQAPLTWARQGDHVLRFREVAGDGASLTDVTIFSRDAAGALTEVLSASRAIHGREGWTLEDGARIAPGAGPAQGFERLLWAEPLEPARARALLKHPRDLPFLTLAELARGEETGAYPGFLYDLWLQRKISGPISIIALALMAAPLALFFDRRRGGGLAMIAGAVALGFVYLAFDGGLLALGEAGLAGPLVAAWGGVFCLTAFGLALALHNERL